MQNEPMMVACTPWLEQPFRLDKAATVFAIGDIHGHAQELALLREFIQREAAEHPNHEVSAVYLGDYIDRGPNSRGVLELLVSPLEGVQQIHIAGNHDQYLVELVQAAEDLPREFFEVWYDNGGTATLQSLGVEGYGRLLMANKLADLRSRILAALGPSLTSFVQGLKAIHRAGDYVFVHAGVDPQVPLDEQDPLDWMLMREPFLSARDGWIHPFCVVHGHSIATPAVHAHRISVDAGCYKSGALCAAQLMGNSLRFVGTSLREDYPWNEKLGGALQWHSMRS